MAGFKLTAGAGSRIAQDLDKLAALVHEQHEVLGVPAWVGLDFARRASLLADHIEKQAGLPVSKRALSEMDLVNESSFGPDNYDPEEIGEEVAGPDEGDADEGSYMSGEFTQQENRELRERVEDGDLGQSMNEEPQAPTPGKQASAERLAAMANGILLKSLGEKHATLMEVASQCACSDVSEVQSLTASVMNLANKVKAAHTTLSAAPFSTTVKDATETVVAAADEVIPHIVSEIKASDASDLGNLLRAASQIVSANSKV